MSVTTWDKYIDYAEQCLALVRATDSREARIARRADGLPLDAAGEHA